MRKPNDDVKSPEIFFLIKKHVFKKSSYPLKRQDIKMSELLRMEMGSKQLKKWQQTEIQSSQIDPDYPEGRDLSHAYYIHEVPIPWSEYGKLLLSSNTVPLISLYFKNQDTWCDYFLSYINAQPLYCTPET